MQLLKEMTAMLQDLDSIPETPTSLEMAIRIDHLWWYSIIYEDNELSYDYRRGRVLTQEQFFDELKNRTTGDIAVVAYFNEKPSTDKIKYFLSELKHEDKFRISIQKVIE